MSDEKFYTKDVAKALGVTPTTVRKYFKDKRYPSATVEKRGKQRLLWIDETRLEKLKRAIESDN